MGKHKCLYLISVVITVACLRLLNSSISRKFRRQNPVAFEFEGDFRAVARPGLSLKVPDGVLQTDSFYNNSTFSGKRETNFYKPSKRPDRAILMRTNSSLLPVLGSKNRVLQFSAVAGNSSNNASWDKISVNGWESRDLRQQNYTCCVLYKSGLVKALPMLRKLRRGGGSEMESRQFVCSVNKVNFKDMPQAVTLAYEESACKENLYYVEIEYPYRQPGKIAVFAKIIFGNISARDLIVWMEIHKHLGYNKVLAYTYRLNSDAMKVTEYYRKQGILEAIPYARPGPEYGFEETPMGIPGNQYYNHQEVSEYDGIERLRGFKYLLSFDIDEYLIPKKKKSLMALFDSLFQQKTDAAGFIFQTYLYMKDWEPTNKHSAFDVGRYLNRSDLTRDRMKLVSKPNLLKDIGLSTHYVVPIHGYVAGEDDAALHHYRSCRKEWLNTGSNFPCFGIRRNYDDSVLKFFREVENDVMSITAYLEI